MTYQTKKANNGRSGHKKFAYGRKGVAGLSSLLRLSGALLLTLSTTGIFFGGNIWAQGASDGKKVQKISAAQAAMLPNDKGLLFLNSDFENGDLTNWTASGNAFDFQPTKGDNPTARTRNQPSQHQGTFWIGTFEKYQGKPGQKPGQRQGDIPTGSLTSIPFEIDHESITFLIGGGKKAESVYVALVIDGREVLKTRGNNSESMQRQTWDVKSYRGKSAHILINDQSNKGWGHINADDFRYQTSNRAGNSNPGTLKEKPKAGALFDNSDFENGDLTNWTASGNAFDFQPTKGDNPTARTRHEPSRHQGTYWIGTFEKYQGKPGQKPGQRQADRPTGLLKSIPFQIDYERITFLIGGGKKTESVYVALVIDGREVLKTTGNNRETMKRQTWDVKTYEGKSAHILISDQSNKGWGHINADNFRFENLN